MQNQVALPAADPPDHPNDLTPLIVARTDDARHVAEPMMHVLALSLRGWFANPRADILSGIVVALALIPEAIGPLRSLPK